ncbi:MAG: enolase N-terminal-like fold-containing protein [Oscillospiraceae bacterium]
MWNFYDELCTGIPSGIRVEGCVVGKLWTTVRANGNIGVARTLGDTGADRNTLGQSMIGRFLRDAANWMKWESLLHASVGVAAMNAFYNTAARAEALSAPPAFQDELGGKRVAVIGELPNLTAGLKDCCVLTVLPLPESRELGGAYDAALTGDFVFISGDALTNQTLPALLDKVGKDTKVSLAGVSVPAAPILFAFDNPLHNLSGVYARFDTTVEGAAAHDVPDLAPGILPFSVNPRKPRRLHESPEVARYQASPYKAAAFNCAFNPWEGRDYDHIIWSPLFKG